MKKTILLFLMLFTAAASFGQRPSMQGLSIGDEFWNRRVVRLPVEAYEEIDAGAFAVKYRTGNGNAFHVTTSSEKVVYMENSWSGRKLDRRPLYTGFIFDVTTLEDIYGMLGSKGIRHESVDGMQDENYVHAVCSYEFSDMKGTMLSLVTKADKPLNGQKVTDPRKFKLVAVIMTEKIYQEVIWGEITGTDPAYRAIHSRILGW